MRSFEGYKYNEWPNITSAEGCIAACMDRGEGGAQFSGNAHYLPHIIFQHL
jgi:hypothetical protein